MINIGYQGLKQIIYKKKHLRRYKSFYEMQETRLI